METLVLPKIEEKQKDNRKFYIESYGCAMNLSDTEIIASILTTHGYSSSNDEKDADVIFLNTCAIRDGAEQKIWTRLTNLKKLKYDHKPDLIVGVLGCMAERLKTKLLDQEKLVDIVVGPDAYRDLPILIDKADDGQKSVNVLLSREETYADIAPLKLNSNGVSAFVSIMRGCDNMCSFCVVPFTRGRERSRDAFSIISECKQLFEQGYKEVILLGQNVDSYKWENPEGEIVNFANLLEMTANVNPNLRVRFSTSHPKDITDEVIYTIAKYDNICNYIHLPIQSGNSRVLELMNRNYTREWYLERIHKIREIIPDCGITTDIITGFCTETEEDHQDTISLMKAVKFDFAFMYAYSERPGTLAARRYKDDIDEVTKKRRLNEIIDLQRQHTFDRNESLIGKTVKALIDGDSRRSENDWKGRSDENIITIFPKIENTKLGDYVNVLIERNTHTSIIGKIVD